MDILFFFQLTEFGELWVNRSGLVSQLLNWLMIFSLRELKAFLKEEG